MYQFFVRSADETLEPLVSRYHLHHHRIVMVRAGERQWDHFRLSHLLHAFQLHRRSHAQARRVRQLDHRIRLEGTELVFMVE